jgi:hypothetical protein
MGAVYSRGCLRWKQSRTRVLDVFRRMMSDERTERWVAEARMRCRRKDVLPECSSLCGSKITGSGTVVLLGRSPLISLLSNPPILSPDKRSRPSDTGP